MSTSEEGWANLVELGETLTFLEGRPYPQWFWLEGSESLLFPFAFRGGTSLHRALVLWLWGLEGAFKDQMCFSSLWRRILWVFEH